MNLCVIMKCKFLLPPGDIQYESINEGFFLQFSILLLLVFFRYKKQL